MTVNLHAAAPRGLSWHCCGFSVLQKHHGHPMVRGICEVLLLVVQCLLVHAIMMIRWLLRQDFVVTREHFNRKLLLLEATFTSLNCVGPEQELCLVFLGIGHNKEAAKEVNRVLLCWFWFYGTIKRYNNLLFIDYSLINISCIITHIIYYYVLLLKCIIY